MKLKTLLCALTALSSVTVGRTEFAHVQGRNIIGTDGAPLHIKGTSLGNWLVPEGYMWRLGDAAGSPHEIEALVALLLGPEKAERFWGDYRDAYVTQSDIDFLARSGCNTIRVPLHYKFFVDDHGDGFRLVDRVVQWCRSAGVYVVLDMHCAPGGQTGTNIDDSSGYPWLFESPTAQAQWVAVWCNIARHYRDEPIVLGYELWNEPLPAFEGWGKYKSLIEPLQRRVLEAVRAIDSKHIVFLTGANWDSDFSVLGSPFAANVAYTFHKYWMSPTETSIREYLDFRERHNVPIWVGETGENKDPWIGEFRQLLETHDIGWTFWPYKKMESTAGFVRFSPPVHWPKVVQFAKRPPGTGSDRVKEGLKLRPSAEELDECFADLLRLVEFKHCEPNRGYIEALGLTLPK